WVADEVVLGPAIGLLAVVPRVRRRPVDAGVGHVHGAIEERAEMHSTLPCRRDIGPPCMRVDSRAAVFRRYTRMADHCNTPGRSGGAQGAVARRRRASS